MGCGFSGVEDGVDREGDAFWRSRVSGEAAAFLMPAVG